MEIRYNVTGSERKRLAERVAAFLGRGLEYLGTPTFAYRADCITIDRNGTVCFDDRAGGEEIGKLLEDLDKAGFVPEKRPVCEKPATEDGGHTGPDRNGTGLTVSVPLHAVNTDNLRRLLEAKGKLIKKALGVAALPVETGDGNVSFPWFTGPLTAEETEAYTHFIAGLCEMSRSRKRVTRAGKDTENDKYSFRCFLLGLGFIGAEYKTERKILLRNLDGSSAFKNGRKGGAGDALSE